MKWKFPELAIILLLALSWSPFIPSANGQDLEYRLKAELMERFTRFVEWPEESSVKDRTIPFLICIAGKNPFGKYLEELANDIKIRGKRVQILEVTDLKQIEFCQILFISSTEEKRLSEILSHAEDRPILTIGDTPGFAQNGVLINFYSIEKYVRFEVNYSTIQKSKLKFSSRLLKLARFVDDNGNDHGSLE